MTDERTDRHPTDEPDGTPAHAASLRPAGTSVDPGPGDGDQGSDEFDALPADDGTGSRARYDTDAVSGDTNAYRPD